MNMEVVFGDVVAGRYQIKGELGKGASSVVYEAFDTQLDRKIALKILNSVPDENLRQRIRREARSAASVSHKGLIDVYDIGEWNESLYLAIEYIADPTLADFLDELRGSVPVESIFKIGKMLSSALLSLHNEGIVHRDLKPANLFVGGSLQAPTHVRIADFGLAFKLGQTDTLGRLSAPDAIGGTPFYMSPEQASGSEVDLSTDIYAVGCILYEMIAGVPPFLGDVADVISKHFYAQPLPLDDLGLELKYPHALTAFVHDMLSKSPAGRPSAKQIYDEFSKNTFSVERGDSKLKTRDERAVKSNDTPLPLIEVTVADATGALPSVPGLVVVPWTLGTPLPQSALGVCVPESSIPDVSSLECEVFVPCTDPSIHLANLVKMGVQGIGSGAKGSELIVRVLRRHSKKLTLT